MFHMYLFFIPKIVLQTAFKTQRYLWHLSEPLYISLYYFEGVPMSVNVYECANG